MNNYSYIDPDYIYTNPKTGVLRNKLNVKEHDAFGMSDVLFAVRIKGYERIWIQ